MKYVFKERLKQLTFLLAAIVVASGLLWIIFLLPVNVVNWIGFGVVVMFILLFVFSFIDWLIIEPIKYSKWYQNKNWKKYQQ